MAFAEKLKELRKERKMSILALAIKSDLSTVAIINYEHGRHIPNALAIAKLAKGLDYDYDTLYDLALKERN